jgi:glutamate racemase
VIQACRGLALAIEQQTEKVKADHQEVERLCADYLREMGRFGKSPGQMDTLVLGCTHYVFAQDILQKIVGPDVQIISTGKAVAKQTQRSVPPLMLALRQQTCWHPMPCNSGPPALNALAHAAERWSELATLQLSLCCP